jgi:hypothetical protein
MVYNTLVKGKEGPAKDGEEGEVQSNLLVKGALVLIQSNIIRLSTR